MIADLGEREIPLNASASAVHGCVARVASEHWPSRFFRCPTAGGARAAPSFHSLQGKLAGRRSLVSATRSAYS